MSYYVRLMSQEDVTQVTEIDREAFPTQWPPPSYQRELQNRLAHYIVVCDEEKIVEQPEVKAPPEKDPARWTLWWRRLFSHHRFAKSEPPSPNRYYIIGFVGFWIMAGEAHITSIAVREAYRRQGLGELLLLSVVDLATELKARIITLEVRTSNTTAQNLYVKYGFAQTGVRRGYYTDNREDGVLMTTEDITSATFQTHFQQLKQAHSSKLGIPTFQIAR